MLHRASRLLALELRLPCLSEASGGSATVWLATWVFAGPAAPLWATIRCVEVASAGDCSPYQGEADRSPRSPTAL